MRWSRWGSEDVKRYLPQLTVRVVGAYALSEAGSGSDAFALATRASADADGFVLNGRKLWITNGNEADVFIVFATLDPAAGHKRHRAAGGTGVRRVHGREEGRQARHSREQHVRTDPRRLPGTRGDVLGEVGKGYKVAIETLNEGRIGIGAQMIGLAQGALDHALRYTQERRQFGKAISDFQAVQHQIARAATSLPPRVCSSTTPRGFATPGCRS